MVRGVTGTKFCLESIQDARLKILTYSKKHLNEWLQIENAWFGASGIFSMHI